MRRARTIGLAVYVLAAIVVVGAFTASLVGPYTARMAALLAEPWMRLVVGVALAIVAIQALAMLAWIVFDRPEPTCVRMPEHPDVEVTCAAIASAVRAAAAACDVMVEDVRVRACGRERDGVDIQMQLIAFDNNDLAARAVTVHEAVRQACERMLGVDAARIGVRFLPAKTVTVTKEMA